MTEPLELCLPPDNSYVGLARQVVVAAARQAGMDEARREDLRIAVGEATTQAIAARARSGDSTPVVLRFGLGGGVFAVTIVGADVGAESTLAGRDGDVPDDWSSGGALALTLLHGLADRVEIEEQAGSMPLLRFTLTLSEAREAAAGERR